MIWKQNYQKEGISNDLFYCSKIGCYFDIKNGMVKDALKQIISKKFRIKREIELMFFRIELKNIIQY
ncbi:unnamed protein product [Paramecium sonneborni]|uniref:Uncharacterized protein n=1 Tax=Paramecium sonneborni TaxID=65129 RepID=A0A8S1K7J2_9CILI|nr:unnamed protein product [Paramecium sonneborni]